VKPGGRRALRRAPCAAIIPVVMALAVDGRVAGGKGLVSVCYMRPVQAEVVGVIWMHEVAGLRSAERRRCWAGVLRLLQAACLLAPSFSSWCGRGRPLRDVLMLQRHAADQRP
jgi:hypothetical protein